MLADTTSNPAKKWKRHSDPPGLWIAVVIGSVALHLLALWLLRSYESSLLSQQQSKSTIPIELVDITAQPKSKETLTARVKPASDTTQKLPKQVVSTQKVTEKPAPLNEDEKAIALAMQRQRELAAQQERELAAQQRELAALEREQAVQEQRQLAAQRQREQAAQQEREQAAQRQREQAAQQQDNASNTDNQEPLSPPTTAAGGSLIASLVGEPQQAAVDRVPNPVKIKPSNQPFTRGLEYVKYIEKGSGQPVEVTVKLIISEKGKLEKVAIADAAISDEEKTYYEDFITNEVLKGWEFEPAYDTDPKNPTPSEIKVRIRIQPLP